MYPFNLNVRVIKFLILFLFISTPCYANSSTTCYEIGNQIQCDTQERDQPGSGGGGFFGGLANGLKDINDDRQRQQDQTYLIQTLTNRIHELEQQNMQLMLQHENNAYDVSDIEYYKKRLAYCENQAYT